MQCGNKYTLAVALIAAVFVVIFFTSTSPSESKQNQSSLADAAKDSSATSSSLRGSEADADQAVVVSEGAFFAADKENVGATLNPTAVTEPHYLQWTWEDLPENIQEEASKLDFTQELWDTGDSFPLLKLQWSDLTREQKEAAKEVGYSRHKWNNQAKTNNKAKSKLSSSTESPTSEDSVFAFEYASYVWEELPLDAQSAAEYLGYSQEMWDTSQYLPLLRTKWKDLTDTQRTAAETLGYDSDIWNHASRFL